jgi:putative inorganic carbon (HCO3(-)) transporter
MISDPKRTAIRHGIAIDLVVLATGAALLLPHSPLVLLAVFCAAVAAAAWVDRSGGFTAAMFSLLALVLLFGSDLQLEHFVAFISIAGMTALFVPLGRALIEQRAIESPAAEAAVAERQRVPALIGLALPMLVLLIYCNASDIIMSHVAIPSPLQGAIAALSIVVWYYRRALRPSGIALHPLTLLLALYCAVLFASTVWADNLGRADEVVVNAVKNLFIYGLAASLATSWRAVHRGLAVLVVAATVFSLIAIAQIGTGSTFGELGGFATVKVGDISGQDFETRAAGPVEDPNFFGQILVLVVPLGLFLAYEEKRTPWRLAWLAMSAVITAGTLVTYSRGAMLALGAMGGLILIAARIRPRYMVAAALAGILFVAFGPSAVSRRVLSLLPSSEPKLEVEGSIAQRRLFYASAALMFDEHPLLGIGGGNFATRFDEYANRIGLTVEDYAPLGLPHFTHMLYLELAAETGLVGLAVFAATALTAFLSLRHAYRELLRRGDRRHALLAMGLGLGIAGYLVTSIFLHGYLMRYLWLLYAFVAAMSRLAFDSELAAQEAG